MVASDVESIDEQVSMEPFHAFGRAAEVEVGVPGYFVLNVEGSSHNLGAIGGSGFTRKWLPAAQPVKRKHFVSAGVT